MIILTISFILFCSRKYVANNETDGCPQSWGGVVLSQRRFYGDKFPADIASVEKRVILQIQLFDKVKSPDEVKNILVSPSNWTEGVDFPIAGEPGQSHHQRPGPGFTGSRRDHNGH